MFDATLRQMLELYPRGATNDQIIWRLRSAGIRLDASELLSALTSLSRRNQIVVDGAGRWRLREFAVGVASARPTPLPAGIDAGAILYAARGRCVPKPAPELVLKPDAADKQAAMEWSSLLSYYAATQRQDPRGRIEEFPDRHGAVWNLFSVLGHWWSEAEIRISSADFPAVFRQTLSSRKVSTAAIGWPIYVSRSSSGISFFPALLIPVEWRFDGDDVVVQTGSMTPSINPAWLRETLRASTWTESQLLDRLFPEGEDDDLAAIADRMRNTLATLGGGVLRPGELVGEVSTQPDGLRNAAGLFLPEDGTFTKGAADNLEELRLWSSIERAETALSALLEGHGTDDDAHPIPVLSALPLTPSQHAAARSALSGRLTVIQGPPGTGKSQVIVALVTSAIMSGRSVLFASKNHQAVDEVEARLKQLAPDAPLLVRGRDADGSRDTNFVATLSEIARGEASRGQSHSEIENTRTAIVGVGEAIQADFTRSEREVRRHLLLSELVERREALLNHLSAYGPLRRSSIFSHIRGLLRRLFRRVDTQDGHLPEDMSLADISRRIEALKAGQSNSPAPDDISTNIERLTKSVGAFLPRLAGAITQPDQTAWSRLAQRVKDLEFQKVKSSRMSADDARAVLQYRPVWAISTLSVPSRVPLVPGLFDYVIFDEASQCDVASSLPLFARARRAIVVGDPMQLRFVPSLGNAVENALMDAAGLPVVGRASVAQSINSLFDFAERRPCARRAFLADQFRSPPAIVDYLNEHFYGGKLVGRRDQDGFRPPAPYKPGLTWEDVQGRVSRIDGGSVNSAEAERVADLVLGIASDPEFIGSVGVISPFNSQVAELQKCIRRKVSEHAAERLSLRIATVDKFQGGEADVILFSLVLAPGAQKSAATFLQRESRRLNVAVSRARALCIIIGDLSHANECGIRHIQFLAERATKPWSPPRPRVFDSGWERRLHSAMLRRGLDPFPQYPVGTRYLDFALDPDGKKIDVEVDGKRWHTDEAGNRKVADVLRDRELRARGWNVLRFWVHELANDMEGCLDRIERAFGPR